MELPTQTAKRIKYMIEIDALVEGITDRDDIGVIAKTMAEGAGESTDNINEYSITKLSASYVENIDCLAVQEVETDEDGTPGY